MIAGDLRMFGRFAFGLPRFLGRPLSLEESRRRVERQREARSESFLTILRRGVFARPRSPYARLLARAGVGFDELAASVGRNGIEETLENLYDAGVFLTYEEFKGHRPVRRSGLNFTVRPRDLDNPLLAGEFELRTGASRSPARRIIVDFGLLAHEAAYHFLSLANFRLDGRPVGIWYSVPPVVSGIKHVLRNAKIGRPVEKWFSQNRLVLRPGTLKHVLFARYAFAVGRVMGGAIPVPEYTPPARAGMVSRWLAAKKKEGVPAEFHANPSSGVRVCRAALEAGDDISGTFFRFNAEPYTPAKAAIVASAGARAAAQYSISEIGNVGMACADPSALDDVHLLTDKLAVLQREKRLPGAGTSVKTLVYTTLLPGCPKLLLNVESDDYGDLETRRCGCLFGALGFDRHLSTIRSYDKLTSDGMTFLGNELVVLVEEVLPELFGGGPTDYQFIEEEEDGVARVSIVVSLRVGEVDERAVVGAVIAALGRGPGSRRVMAERWREGKTLRVVRREPCPTGAAKILPLHLIRRD
jgi:hypothetical protein